MKRRDRTVNAMQLMGPSILKAAASTMLSAIPMLFCSLSVFVQFAVFLCLTMVYSVLVCFGFFIALASIIGPEPKTKPDKL